MAYADSVGFRKNSILSLIHPLTLVLGAIQFDKNVSGKRSFWIPKTRNYTLETFRCSGRLAQKCCVWIHPLPIALFAEWIQSVLLAALSHWIFSHQFSCDAKANTRLCVVVRLSLFLCNFQRCVGISVRLLMFVRAALFRRYLRKRFIVIIIRYQNRVYVCARDADAAASIHFIHFG